MSIKYWVNTFNPELGQKDYSLNDLFNPKLSPTLPRGEHLKVKDLWNHWKALYTKENLRNNPDVFFPSIHKYVAAGVKTREWMNANIDAMLSVFTDDNIWVLSRINYDRWDGQNINIWSPVVYKIGHDEGTTDKTLNKWVEESGWTRCQVGIDEFQKFKPLLSKLADQWSTLFLEHYGKIWGDRNYTLSSDQLQYDLFCYMTNRHSYLGPDGNTIDTVNLLAKMVANPSIKVSYNIKGSRHGYRLTYSEPCDNLNREPVKKLLEYSMDILSILPHPMVVENEYNPGLYGVELELSTNYTVAALVDAQDMLFAAYKKDSSITGSKNYFYEMVTVPMSMKVHRRQWAKWFSRLEYDHFDTSNKTNNGMHVHVDKTAFRSAQHIRNFCWFINNPAHREFIFLLSERNRASFNKYSQCFDVTAGTKKIRAIRNAQQEAAKIRGAVNIHKNGKTVEVRIFRGIVSYASVLKNLELVDSLVEFTAELSYQGFTLGAYLDWMNKQPRNRYSVARKFLHDLDTEQLLHESEIKEIIFTEEDPDRIVEIIEKSKFPIAQVHVSYLNRTRKKRVFVLNPQTKKLEVLIRDRGKVAHLDKTLQDRYAAA